MTDRLSFRTLEDQICLKNGRRLTNQELAGLFGTNRRWVRHMRRMGIRVREADKYAVAAGFHPSSVWGNQWWELQND